MKGLIAIRYDLHQYTCNFDHALGEIITPLQVQLMYEDSIEKLIAQSNLFYEKRDVVPAFFEISYICNEAARRLRCKWR